MSAARGPSASPAPQPQPQPEQQQRQPQPPQQPQQFEGALEKMKEQNDKLKQQVLESQHRERVLVRRLAAKEQEVQDYAAQIAELKSAQVNSVGVVGNARSCMLDPSVNVLVMRMKQELTSTRNRLEETQNEFSAWKFTPDSNTGKKLMAKCRLLHQENEDLGRMTTSGRIAKLEGDLALQKSFSEEAKKSQSELDEFLQELDEEVEGMQSTIYLLQQELRSLTDRNAQLNKEIQTLRTKGGGGAPPPPPPLTNGAAAAAEDYDSEPDLILKVSERERLLCDEDDDLEEEEELGDSRDGRTRPVVVASGGENGTDNGDVRTTNCDANDRQKTTQDQSNKRGCESDSSSSEEGGGGETGKRPKKKPRRRRSDEATANGDVA